MANKEHLEIFRQGVEVWNQWRKGNNDVKPDLSSIELHDLNLKRVNLREANLTFVDFSNADLSKADLSSADLSQATLVETNLTKANLTRANLTRANLTRANLTRAELPSANLYEANLDYASLFNADLFNADLSDAYLIGANLTKAQLIKATLINTNLKSANLTGACIKDWNINSETSFVDVHCKYIYKNHWNYSKFLDRIPKNSNGTFKPGEFEALIHKQIDTIDLIFVDGIDWQAFFQSFQELRTQYQDSEIAIQAIERKGKGAFVIRLETLAVPEIGEAIEDSAKKLYERNIKQLEAQVTDYAKLIEAEKAEKSTLMGIVKTMAENQGSKYDLRGAKFGGGFAAEGGCQEGGQFNDYSIQVGANMDEITKLIQSLKTTIQTFPKEQQADIDIEIEELKTDVADEQRRDPKRLGKHVRSLWLAACAIALGVAGVADFSNNVLELSKKLNVPIPIELIQQNPHILPGS